MVGEEVRNRDSYDQPEGQVVGGSAVVLSEMKLTEVTRLPRSPRGGMDSDAVPAEQGPKSREGRKEDKRGPGAKAEE